MPFVSGLMVQRVPFIVAELGRDADPFMLHLYNQSAPRSNRSNLVSETGTAPRMFKSVAIGGRNSAMMTACDGAMMTAWVAWIGTVWGE
jgi:hypothetical protein